MARRLAVAEVPRVYWDANLFIAWLNQRRRYWPTLDELLRRSTSGEMEIVASNITIAEVAYYSRDRSQAIIAPDSEAVIRQLLTDEQRVLLVPFTDETGFAAQSLVRRWRRIRERLEPEQRRRRLEPSDAIHLASAMDSDVDELLTTDSDLIVIAGRLNCVTARAPV